MFPLQNCAKAQINSTQAWQRIVQIQPSFVMVIASFIAASSLFFCFCFVFAVARTNCVFFACKNYKKCRVNGDSQGCLPWLMALRLKLSLCTGISCYVFHFSICFFFFFLNALRFWTLNCTWRSQRCCHIQIMRSQRRQSVRYDYERLARGSGKVR